MHRKAARQRALAAAAFHGGYRDDHAPHSHGLEIDRVKRISTWNGIGFAANCLSRRGCF
jgi:hypothetical protein